MPLPVQRVGQPVKYFSGIPGSGEKVQKIFADLYCFLQMPLGQIQPGKLKKNIFVFRRTGTPIFLKNINPLGRQTLQGVKLRKIQRDKGIDL